MQKAQISNFLEDFPSPDLSVLRDVNLKMAQDVGFKKDKLIEGALHKRGFDVNNFAPGDFSFVTDPTDDFEHLFYKHRTAEELRIISFQKMPELTFNTDFVTNSVTQKVSYKYY